MKLTKPTCAHCGKKAASVKLYWCKRNLLKSPMKTHYCNHCARIVVPGQEHIRTEHAHTRSAMKPEGMG